MIYELTSIFLFIIHWYLFEITNSVIKYQIATCRDTIIRDQTCQATLGMVSTWMGDQMYLKTYPWVLSLLNFRKTEWNQKNISKVVKIYISSNSFLGIFGHVLMVLTLMLSRMLMGTKVLYAMTSKFQSNLVSQCQKKISNAGKCPISQVKTPVGRKPMGCE